MVNSNDSPCLTAAHRDRIVLPLAAFREKFLYYFAKNLRLCFYAKKQGIVIKYHHESGRSAVDTELASAESSQKHLAKGCATRRQRKATATLFVLLDFIPTGYRVFR